MSRARGRSCSARRVGARPSRYVCVATAHMVMEAYDSAEFREIVNGADLVTPDGMPLVWGLRWLGGNEGGGGWGPAPRGRVGPVMLGVGAAFDFLAGTKPWAPRWMQQAGLEWLFRLATEPRRLWRRYLRHTPPFSFIFGLP